MVKGVNMPRTRGGKMSSAEKRTLQKNKARKDSRSTVMESPVANANNCHSVQGVRTTMVSKSPKAGKTKHGNANVMKLNEPIASPKCKQKSSHTEKKMVAMETSQNNSFGDRASESNGNTDQIEFKEDGELIQMEINDGGAAVDEFASEADPDTEVETESEDDSEGELEAGEVTTDEQSEPVHNYTSSEESELENEQSPEETRVPQKRRKQSNQKESDRNSKSAWCKSVEERLDSLTDTLNVVKEFMMTQMKPADGHQAEATTTDKVERSSKDKGKTGQLQPDLYPSNSETTIYQNALIREENKQKDNIEFALSNQCRVEDDPEISFKPQNENVNEENKNVGFSSDERIDTSDELMEVDINDRFIADCEKEARRRSADKGATPYAEQRRLEDLSQAEKVIRDAETSKAMMFGVKGNELTEGNIIPIQLNNLHHATLVDDKYVTIGGHIDQGVQEKIRKGEYIDFARLLPRTTSGNHSGEDQRMELINRGGLTYFVPVSERENSGITSFSKWEQAFRIFMNVYTQEFPNWSSELIQYNHIIFTEASTYSWDNVYTYDKEFRLHMSRYPNRSWAAILQQAWTIYLKDRLRNDGHNFHGSGGMPSNKRKKDACKRFNKGLCTAGLSCKYDHQCLGCGKFGHGPISAGESQTMVVEVTICKLGEMLLQMPPVLAPRWP